jgi:NOL1/NOP2/fmu family ribosome biogenesis protein
MSDDEPVDGTNASDEPAGDAGEVDEPTESNDGQQFDRLPETAGDRTVVGRATRDAVLEWWQERFGVDPAVFDEHTFWEKGAGKVWAFAGDLPDPTRNVEAAGMTFLRTRQEHWKPTTDAAQRFGRYATKNTIRLDDAAAKRFVAGEDQDLDWDGDWGYVIPVHDVAGRAEPLGVGLYVYDELKSMVPKGRRRDV